MPKYKKNISHIVTFDEAEQMILKSDNPRDRFLIAILYLTGARPQELTYLKAEHIKDDGVYLNVQLKTLKLGGHSKEKFMIEDRRLEFKHTDPFIKYVVFYLKNKKEELLPISATRIKQIVYKLSDNQFCPYNFRHSRLTKLANAGATVSEIMSFKGAADVRSVSPYLRGKPIGRRLVID